MSYPVNKILVTTKSICHYSYYLERARYGIEPREGNPTYRSDSEVICTAFYSKLDPLEDGEVYLTIYLIESTLSNFHLLDTHVFN